VLICEIGGRTLRNRMTMLLTALEKKNILGGSNNFWDSCCHLYIDATVDDSTTVSWESVYNVHADLYVHLFGVNGLKPFRDGSDKETMLISERGQAVE
jgi:hypothetical protein